MRGIFPLLKIQQKCKNTTRGFFPPLKLQKKCKNTTRGFFPLFGRVAFFSWLFSAQRRIDWNFMNDWSNQKNSFCFIDG